MEKDLNKFFFKIIIYETNVFLIVYDFNQGRDTKF